MDTFLVILLVAIVVGGVWFSYWAIQKTLNDGKSKKPRKNGSRRRARV